jgi:hypothetical protein
MKKCDLCERETDCLYELKLYKPHSEKHDSIDTCLSCHLKIKNFVSSIQDGTMEKRIKLQEEFERKMNE